MSAEWLRLYTRYEQDRSAISSDLLEKVQRLLQQESPSTIRQGVHLLAAFGSEQICQLLAFDGAQVRIALPEGNDALEACIIAFVSQDEVWSAAYRSGVFDALEYRVLKRATPASLTPAQQETLALFVELELEDLVKMSKEEVFIHAGETAVMAGPSDFFLWEKDDDVEWLWASEFPEGRIKEEIRKVCNHPVRIERPFWMFKYPVSVALWKVIMGPNYPHHSDVPDFWEYGDALPMTKVRLPDWLAFCNRLSHREGLQPVYTKDGVDIAVLRDELLAEGRWSFCLLYTSDAADE